jgi:hypothetical protein
VVDIYDTHWRREGEQNIFVVELKKKYWKVLPQRLSWLIHAANFMGDSFS